MRAFEAVQDQASATIAAENAARDASVAAQLRIIGIQNSLATSLAQFDTALKGQANRISALDFSLGGNAPVASIGSAVNDLSARNLQGPEFANGLNAAAGLSPEFAAQAQSVTSALQNLDSLSVSIAEYQAAATPAQKERIMRGIAASLERSGIDSADGQIGDAIIKSIEKGGNPIDIKKDITDKFISPLADSLESGRQAINQALSNQATTLEKLTALDQQRLESSLNTIKSDQEMQRSINTLLGIDKDRLVEKSNRISLASTTLEGTRFANQVGAGGASAVENLGTELAANKRREARLASSISNVTNPQEAERLQSELANSIAESKKLTSAIEQLADVTAENTAIEEKLADSRAIRSELKSAATNLAFGTQESRQEFGKNLFGANLIARTGTTSSISEEGRGGVLSLLQQFKSLRGFGGSTGKEVIDTATANFLTNELGVPMSQVSLVMDDFTASEMEMVDLIRANYAIDRERNVFLERIAEAADNRGQNAANNLQAPIQFASGGPLGINFAPKGTDTVPAMLTPGEFVVKKSAVNKYGAGLLHSINSEQYANGGKVGYFANGGEIRKENIYRGDQLKQIWKFNLSDLRTASSQKLDPSIIRVLQQQQQPELQKLKDGDSYGDVFRSFKPRKNLIQAGIEYQKVLTMIADSNLLTKQIDPASKISPFQAWDLYREAFFGALKGQNAVASSGPLSGIQVNSKGLINGIQKDVASNGARVKTMGLPFSGGTGDSVGNLKSSTLGLINLFGKMNFEKIFPAYSTQLTAFKKAVEDEHIKSGGTVLGLRGGGYVKNRTEAEKEILRKKAAKNKVRADAYRAAKAQRQAAGEETEADIRSGQFKIARNSRADIAESKNLQGRESVKAFRQASEEKKARIDRSARQGDAYTDGQNFNREAFAHLDIEENRTGVRPSPSPITLPPSFELDNAQKFAAQTANVTLEAQDKQTRTKARLQEQNAEVDKDFRDTATKRFISTGFYPEGINKDKLPKEIIHGPSGEKSTRIQSLEELTNSQWLSWYERQISSALREDKATIDLRESIRKRNESNAKEARAFLENERQKQDKKDREEAKAAAAAMDARLHSSLPAADRFYRGQRFTFTKGKTARQNMYNPRSPFFDPPKYGFSDMFKSFFRTPNTKYRAEGGHISPIGTDTVPAMLTPGEFVVKKSAVDKYGPNLMRSINSKKFEHGGSVPDKTGSKGFKGFSTSYNHNASIDINYQSLNEFNIKFKESVDKLQSTNMKFEVSLTNKDFNINILGADILSKLPEVVSLLVLGTISSKIDIITQSVKKRLSSGV
jgi:hypothetical protein